MQKHKTPNQTIKDELIKQDISQLQASYDLGIHRVEFNHIANGWVIPTPEKRSRISGYLGLPETDLFNL